MVPGRPQLFGSSGGWCGRKRCSASEVLTGTFDLSKGGFVARQVFREGAQQQLGGKGDMSTRAFTGRVVSAGQQMSEINTMSAGECEMRARLQ